MGTDWEVCSCEGREEEVLRCSSMELWRGPENDTWWEDMLRLGGEITTALPPVGDDVIMPVPELSGDCSQLTPRPEGERTRELEPERGSPAGVVGGLLEMK